MLVIGIRERSKEKTQTNARTDGKRPLSRPPQQGRGVRNGVMNLLCRAHARLHLRNFRHKVPVFPRNVAYTDHGRMAYLPAASSAITRYVKPPSDT